MFTRVGDLHSKNLRGKYPYWRVLREKPVTPMPHRDLHRTVRKGNMADSCSVKQGKAKQSKAKQGESNQRTPEKTVKEKTDTNVD